VAVGDQFQSFPGECTFSGNCALKAKPRFQIPDRSTTILTLACRILEGPQTGQHSSLALDFQSIRSRTSLTSFTLNGDFTSTVWATFSFSFSDPRLSSSLNDLTWSQLEWWQRWLSEQLAILIERLRDNDPESLLPDLEAIQELVGEQRAPDESRQAVLQRLYDIQARLRACGQSSLLDFGNAKIDGNSEHSKVH
jgi:hypothetical protein